MVKLDYFCKIMCRKWSAVCYSEVIVYKLNCAMESTPLLDTQPPVITYRRLVTIEPVLFLFSLYFAGSVPLIDQFVESQLKQRYNFTVSDIQCGVSFNYSTADQIKAEASTWLIYMNVAVMVLIVVLFDCIDFGYCTTVLSLGCRAGD